LRSHGDFLPKLPIFLWTGELLVPKVQIFFPISLALSPEFVTNTLLGLSRPVGRVPEEVLTPPPLLFQQSPKKLRQTKLDLLLLLLELLRLLQPMLLQ
jgi:hypothetical protein